MNEMTPQQILEQHWLAATIRDNFIFGKTFETNPDLCCQLIESILNIKVKDLRYPEREKVVEARADSKGIRLDVYAEDKGSNRSFDIEMQVTNNDNLGKRMRYYQGLIDLDKLKHGQHYRELGEVFIIFICPFKVFRGGRHIYTFRDICVENPKISLDNGATKIFLSTKGTADDVSDTVKNFLNYVDNGVVTGSFVKDLDAAVQLVKSNKKVRLEFMTYEMALLDRELLGEERGRSEGRAEERIDMVKNFLDVGTPIEFIIKATGWSEDKILKLKTDTNANSND